MNFRKRQGGPLGQNRNSLREKREWPKLEEVVSREKENRARESEKNGGWRVEKIRFKCKHLKKILSEKAVQLH